MPEPTPAPGQPPAPPPAPPAAAAPSTAVTATPPKPAAPPSAKPAAPAKPPAKGPTRRFFLLSWFGSWFAVAWWTFAASMVGMLLGTVRFLFPNVLSEPPSSFRAGDIGSFEPGKVEDKFKEQGAWVIRGRDESQREIIYALSTTCTHLGCTPNWLEADKKFKCPCHGSGFRITGVNFEGPAPRPLERYAVRKTDDNQVLVDKSQKFQRELGQWEDTQSYIPV
jgi:cytochrome b6-f complex iron-sulfur subunit